VQGLAAPGSAAGGTQQRRVVLSENGETAGKATPAQAAHPPLSFVCTLSTAAATTYRRFKAAVEQSTLAVASVAASVVGCGVMAAPNPGCQQVGQPGGSVSDSQ
jgi:hypothetical protein